MKNKNKTVWSKRFKEDTSKSFQRIGSSINVDKRLYKQDILASIVHSQMLVKQKIISQVQLNIPTYTKDNLPEDLLKIQAVKPGSRTL